MLLRPGKLGIFCLFAVVVFVWTSVHQKSRDTIHSGWQVTTQAFKQSAQVFGQGGSFATDSVSVEVVAAEPPSPYAYVFYATQDTYACSVLINVRHLQEVHKTKHRIFVMVTDQVSVTYREAFERMNAIVSVQTPAPLAEGTEGIGYYADCLLKLQGFRMHQIDSSLKRVIVLDSDQMVLKNLDYLFEDQIEVDLAAPRAYWIARETISTAFMMITLSDRLWDTMDHAIKNIGVNKYDMDLVNDVLGETVLMLPGSFVTLNSHWEDWNLPKWFHKTKKFENGTVGHNVAVVKHKTGLLPGSGDLVKRQDDDVHSPAIDDVESQQQESEVQNTQGETGTKTTDTTELPKVEGITYWQDVKNEENSNPEGLTFLKETKLEDIEDSSSSSTPDSDTDAFPTSEDVPEIQYEELPPKPTSDDSNLDTTTIPSDPQTSKHHNGKPHTNLPPSAGSKFNHAVPYIPNPPLASRPLYNELFELYEAVHVLHFTALGKPWMVSNSSLSRDRPEAHPLFREQFLFWREEAAEVCPGGVVGVV